MSAGTDTEQRSRPTQILMAGLHRSGLVRSRTQEAAPLAEVDEQTISGQQAWTGGPALLTQVCGVVVTAALLAGPAALALTMFGTADPAPTSTAVKPLTDPAAAPVGNFATRFVTAWLQAARGDEQQLQPFLAVDSGSVSLPDQAWQVSEPAVVSATAAPGRSDQWSVVVSAHVSLGSAPAVTRFFQVAVDRDPDGAMAALTLPAPVAGPAAGVAASVAYPNSMGLDAALPVAATAFLSALVTGTGDVGPYLSPESSITAITPPPYRRVRIRSVITDLDLTQLPATPRDGVTVRALVTADVTASTTTTSTVQWPLTMRARAGRWEVLSVDPRPRTGPDQEDQPS